MSRVRLVAAAVFGMALLVSLVASPAQAAVKPAAPLLPPVPITVQVASAFGSGCPAGTTFASPTDDYQAFSLSFSAFRVYGGDYKNCKVNVKVSMPQGWTYAIYSIINRVSPNLAVGSSARLQMDAWFTGYSFNASADNSLAGPSTSLWTTTSTPGSLMFMPCSTVADLNVNDRLSVSGAAKNSVELIDLDVRVSTIFNLRWRQC